MSAGTRSVAATVAGKELRELFRDYRSVALTVLVPLLLFPLLFLLLDENVELQREIRERHRAVEIAPDYDLPPAYRAALQDYGVRVLAEADGTARDRVAHGRVLLAIDREGRILYNERSESSTVEASRLAGEIAALIAGTNGEESTSASVIPQLLGVHGGTGSAALGGATFAALLLMLAALISPLPAALDLGAGEKQRQSLEFLLLATGRRGGIVLGKLAATSLTGFLGVLSFVGGVGIARRIVPELFVTATSLVPLTPAAILLLVTLAALLTVLLSAMELVISIYARSPREAQSLFLPLLLLVSGTAYVTVLSDVWYLSAWYGWVPLLNLGLLLKSTMLDAPGFLGSTAGIVVVLVENTAVLVVCMLIGRLLLRSEMVIRRS